MADDMIVPVFPTNRRAMAAVDALLAQEGIRRDGNLDYTCAMYDGDRVIATGSCFGSTLRCLAVSSDRQGEGLMNQIIAHLTQLQMMRGNLHLFLYTKAASALFFQDLGFYEIARVDGTLSFLENRRTGFPDYLQALERTRRPGVAAALVMNANPFTLGHQYLVETAAARCDVLHLFLVSEDASLVPYAVRRHLVEAGIAHIPNVILHDSGPYIISSATFPSYFLKDDAAVAEGHAKLDLAIFSRISQALGITARYVGEESSSTTTALYNRVMQQMLPACGVDCIVIPRRQLDGKPISASTVRQCIQAGDMDAIRPLVPQTTWDYFTSPEAAGVIDRIRRAENVVHH